MKKDTPHDINVVVNTMHNYFASAQYLKFKNVRYIQVRAPVFCYKSIVDIFNCSIVTLRFLFKT